MKTSIATLLLGAAASTALLATAVTAKEPADGGKMTLAQFTYKPPVRGAPSTRVGGGSRSGWTPPMRGAPSTRVGGGSRSAGVRAPQGAPGSDAADTSPAVFNLRLNVLAPGETGYTLQGQPTVYWFASEAIDSPVELTVISIESLRAASKPALEITLKPPIAKGVHALRLAEHGVTLKPDVEYQWYVAVVLDPAQRSNDVLAGGTIKRVSADAAMQSKLKQTAPAQLPGVYAQGGIWYDAIDQLSKQIGAGPEGQRSLAQRAELLEQVGLGDAAAFDRGS